MSSEPAPGGSQPFCPGANALGLVDLQLYERRAAGLLGLGAHEGPRRPPAASSKISYSCAAKGCKAPINNASGVKAIKKFVDNGNAVSEHNQLCDSCFDIMCTQNHIDLKSGKQRTSRRYSANDKRNNMAAQSDRAQRKTWGANRVTAMFAARDQAANAAHAVAISVPDAWLDAQPTEVAEAEPEPEIEPVS